MVVQRKHRGSRSELQGCLYLMNQGYDVFRAVSAHGPVDLVAIRGSETLRIDVKTVLGRRRSPPAGGNISYLLVTPDGCELIRPLPPARRALPVRSNGRRPTGRYQLGTRQRLPHAARV